MIFSIEKYIIESIMFQKKKYKVQVVPTLVATTSNNENISLQKVTKEEFYKKYVKKKWI